MTSGHSPPSPESLPAAASALVEFDSQSFARLDRWMDRRLDVLEQRWRHRAAPAARQVVRRQFSQRR